MTAMERLGWTLIHFGWQGAAIALLYGVIRRYLQRPGSRYLLACGALTMMLSAPLITWSLTRPAEANSKIVAPDRTARVPGHVPATSRPMPPDSTTPHHPAAVAQWTAALWFAGATVLSFRLILGWFTCLRIRLKYTRPAPLEWCQTIEQLARRLRLSSRITLHVSPVLDSPMVIGALRPLVLVPVGLLTGLPAGMVETLLLHELAHIRRHDYLVNLLQSAAEALLFYHPAVWWVSAHLREERERCCDDLAVAVSGDLLTYVNALAELESSRAAHLAAVAANGSSLTSRIARLLGESHPAARSGRGALFGMAILLAAAYSLFGQAEPRPTFEAASVKPNTTNPSRRMFRPQPGGGAMSENAPLLMLIQNAYSVQGYQVVGGPSWVQTDGFDIMAKPPQKTTEAEMRLMLQSLLAERFKLSVHRDTRELPVYLLTPAKGTFAPAAPASGCEAGATVSGGIPCGQVGIRASPSGLDMNGKNAPMSQFIRMLAVSMGHPVVDHTGYTGAIDVHLVFNIDESIEGLPPGFTAPPNPDRSTIFVALQEQMGLKLTSSKAPVDVLVIDHVEKPTAN